MRLNTVCQRDCPGRHPGCAANCEKRKAEREANLARYQKKANEWMIDDVLASGVRRRIRRR